MDNISLLNDLYHVIGTAENLNNQMNVNGHNYDEFDRNKHTIKQARIAYDKLQEKLKG